MNGRELIAVLFTGKVDKVVISPERVYNSRTECSGIIQVTKCIEDEYKRQKISEGSYIRVHRKLSILNRQPKLNALLEIEGLEGMGYQLQLDGCKN